MIDRHLRTIRDFELDRLIRLIPPPSTHPRLLEVGAGTGQQSARLAALGYSVTAIDLPNSVYKHQRIHPIIDYDGRTLPAKDGSIDVIYTSNVLEHVQNLASLLQEFQRVLAPNGIAIHVLPTTTWRVLTLATHYPSVIRRVAGRIASKPTSGAGAIHVEKTSPRQSIVADAWPKRHGERGNAFTECWYFSEAWWRGTFRSARFIVSLTESVGIAYSGGVILGTRLSITARTHVASIIGASGRIYVTKSFDSEALQ